MSESESGPPSEGVEYQRAREGLAQRCAEYPDPVERTDMILKQVEAVAALVYSPEEATPIRDAINACRTITEEGEYIEQMLRALQPIIEAQHRPEIQKQMRKSFIEHGNFKPLGAEGILAYGETDDRRIIHIHLAPARDVKILELRPIVVDGLKDLAARIQNDPDKWRQLDRITGTSWIVAEHPKLLERLGFTIVGPIDDDIRQRYFSGSDRPISEAVITKEDLLKRYGHATADQEAV